jgi:hypothetical protein
MQKTIAILFLLIFSGLGFYFFFAEDYCPVHCSPADGGSFYHVHHTPASICLCFWSTLFAPGSFDFSCFQGVERLALKPFDASPLRSFNADIAHPPRAASA